MRRRNNLLLNFIVLLLLAGLGLYGCGESVSREGQGDGSVTALSEPDAPVLSFGVGDYPNADLLVSGDELESSLSNVRKASQVSASESEGFVLIDARGGPLPDPQDADYNQHPYVQGHIPGAISLTWQEFGVPNLNSVSELEDVLTNTGVTRDMTIIIYDDTTASWGAAGRLFWMLEYLGCKDVHLLYGGWDKWVADGRTTETGANTLPDAPAFVAQVNTNVLATKEHIRYRRGDADFALIDARTDEEYNGWTLYGEARGGHVAGAIQIPYEWFFYDNKTILVYEDLKELFESRGITPDMEVSSYCTAAIRSGFVYFALRLMGYPNCSNYDGAIYEWAAASVADPNSYPMEEMKNYSELVYPAWVQALIDYHAQGSTEPAPPEYAHDRNHKYLIFETQWGSFDDMAQGWADDSYLQGHIPGAIHSNSDTYENGYPRWFLLPDDELKAAVGKMGITEDTTVVVYSDSPIFAARLWWILKYAGIEDVRLLNGGFEAWVAAGYEEETTINKPVAVTYNGTIRSELIATTDYVEAHYNDGNTILSDVRTYEEYTGEVSGYSYVVNKGRVPGAVYAFNADNPDREYLDDDGTLRNFTELRAMWQGVGIESTVQDDQFDSEVIFYCGSGYRSSLGFLHAYLMGYENIRNYSDGWEGWSTSYTEDPTYVADPDVPGSTDGWIQDPSGRPVGDGVHPDWDMDGYPNVDRVVDARWVKEVLFENNNFGRPFVIADVSWGPAKSSFTDGHVPGAIHINTDEIEYDCFNPRNDWPVDAGDPACWDRSTTEEDDAAKGLGPDDALPRNWWNIYPDQYLLPAIAYMGIDRDTTVVVYGSSASAPARVMWTLMYAGVEDVRLLEGGYNAWIAAGYEGSSGSAVRTPVADFGATAALHPEYLVDIPYVRQVVNGDIADALLVDTRSEEEYLGASRPYSYIPTDGRIPGALWGSDEFENSDGTLIAPADIEAFWASQGITPDKHLSFYCGTAWRSSLAWLYGYMMGYPNISNFDSSWFEWSMGEGSDYNGDDPVLNPIVDESPGLP